MSEVVKRETKYLRRKKEKTTLLANKGKTFSQDDIKQAIYDLHLSSEKLMYPIATEIWKSIAIKCCYASSKNGIKNLKRFCSRNRVLENPAVQNNRLEKKDFPKECKTQDTKLTANINVPDASERNTQIETKESEISITRIQGLDKEKVIINTKLSNKIRDNILTRSRTTLQRKTESKQSPMPKSIVSKRYPDNNTKLKTQFMNVLGLGEAVSKLKLSKKQHNQTDASVGISQHGHGTESSIGTSQHGHGTESSIGTSQHGHGTESSIGTSQHGHGTESSIGTSQHGHGTESSIGTSQHGHGTESSIGTSQHGHGTESSIGTSQHGHGTESSIGTSQHGHGTESSIGTSQHGHGTESSIGTSQHGHGTESSIGTSQHGHGTESSIGTSQHGHGTESSIGTSQHGHGTESSIGTSQHGHGTESSIGTSQHGHGTESSIGTSQHGHGTESSIGTSQHGHGTESSIGTSHHGHGTESSIGTSQHGHGTESSIGTSQHGHGTESSIGTSQHGHGTESSIGTSQHGHGTESSIGTSQHGHGTESSIGTSQHGHGTESSIGTSQHGHGTESSIGTSHHGHGTESSIGTSQHGHGTETSIGTSQHGHGTETSIGTSHHGHGTETSIGTSQHGHGTESSIGTSQHGHGTETSIGTSQHGHGTETSIGTSQHGHGTETSIGTSQHGHGTETSIDTSHHGHGTETSIGTSHHGHGTESSIGTSQHGHGTETSIGTSQHGHGTETSIGTSLHGHGTETSIGTSQHGHGTKTSIGTSQHFHGTETSIGTSHHGHGTETSIGTSQHGHGTETSIGTSQHFHGTETYTGSSQHGQDKESYSGTSQYGQGTVTYTSTSQHGQGTETYTGISQHGHGKDTYTGTSQHGHGKDTYTGTSQHGQGTETYTSTSQHCQGTETYTSTSQHGQGTETYTGTSQHGHGKDTYTGTSQHGQGTETYTSTSQHGQGTETYTGTSQHGHGKDTYTGTSQHGQGTETYTSTSQHGQGTETYTGTSQHGHGTESSIGSQHGHDTENSIGTSQHGKSKIHPYTEKCAFGKKFPVKYFEEQVAEEGCFYISNDQWSFLLSKQKGRCFKTGTWEHIVSDGIKHINPYCVYMFKWHRVSAAIKRKPNKEAPVFHGEAVCKFDDCKNICKFQMGEDRRVSVKISSHVKHNITEKYARPVRGEERKALKEKCEGKVKPFKLYLDEFQKVDPEVKMAGNYSGFGASKHTIQQISSESNYQNRMDKSEYESTVKLHLALQNETPEAKCPGFIQQLSIIPPYVFYWTEVGIRLWHDLGKEVMYWDATGTVIKPREDKRKYFYYEIAAKNPTSNEAAIPVASMLSSLHSMPLIRFWLGEFRRAEKKIFGHNNTTRPRQIISDRSLAFIQAALSEFNNEDLNLFRSRAWKIVTGNADQGDLESVFPHSCLSHIMSSFKKLLLTHYKTNFEFGMYCCSLIVNSTTLAECKDVLRAVYQVLSSPVLDRKTETMMDFIQTKINQLPVNLKGESDSTEEVTTDESLLNDCPVFPKDIDANQLTEEDFENRSTSNEFYKMSQDILMEVRNDIDESIFVEMPGNDRFSVSLAEKIHKLFMPTFPLWSSLLLGNLSRHGYSKIYSSSHLKENVERSNSSIEKRFQILKDIELSNRTTNRIDEFSARLHTHVKSIQELAILNNVKTGKQRTGRSTKTIEEEWDKGKVRSEKPVSGKYQKAPRAPLKRRAKLPPKRCHPEHKGPENVKKRRVDKTHEQTKDNSNTDPASSVLNKMSYITDDMEVEVLRRGLSGICNIGNSCWFGAVITALKPAETIQKLLDMYGENLTLCQSAQSIIKVINKSHSGMEVTENDVQDALICCQQKYGISLHMQNDADEFLNTAIAELIQTTGARNLIKVKETSTCVSCGRRTENEQTLACLQLSIPPVYNATLQEVLNYHFRDEELENCMCESCGNNEKFKKCIPVYMPNTIVLSIKRYKLNKFERVVKDDTFITLDQPISIPQEEPGGNKSYQFRSAVLHHGINPTSGHYTALLKAGNAFISVDDEAISRVYRHSLNTDGYIIVLEACGVLRSNCLEAAGICLANSQCLQALQSFVEKKPLISPQKKLIVDRLHNIIVHDSKLTRDVELTFLLQRICQTPGDEIPDILEYIIGSAPLQQLQTYGLEVLISESCQTCNTVQYACFHRPIVSPDDIVTGSFGTKVSTKNCRNCNELSKVSGRTVSFGSTLIVEVPDNTEWPFNGLKIDMRVLANEIFSFKTILYRIVAVLDTEYNVLLISNDDSVLRIELDKGEITTLQTSVDEVVKCKKAIVLLDQKEAQVDHGTKVVNGQSFKEMFGWEQSKTLHITTLDKKAIEQIENFPQGISFHGLSLNEEEWKRFMDGWLTDQCIDLYSAVLKERCPVSTPMTVLPASWYGRYLSNSKLNIESCINMEIDNMLLIPANINNNHWISIAVLFHEKKLIYMDPLGNLDMDVIDKVLNFVQLKCYTDSLQRMDTSAWIIMNAASADLFPKQVDDSSCGIFVCLYVKQILSQSELTGPLSELLVDLRRTIGHEILTTAFFDTEQPFGLKEIIIADDLEDFVNEILTSDKNCRLLKCERHVKFLRNPTFCGNMCLVNYGIDFISPKSYAYMQMYLLNRFFYYKKLDPRKIFSSKVGVIKGDDKINAELNKILIQNTVYCGTYVQEVLIKEVTTWIVSNRLHIGYKEANDLCSATEVSAFQYKRQAKKNAL